MHAAVIVVLLILEIVTATALALLWRRYADQHAELERLRDQQPLLTPTVAQQAAGWAVKTVVGTAVRVRERGFVGGLLLAPIEELTQWAAEDRDEIAAVAAPDGTVTILFSDIEDSTRLNERLGDDRFVRLLAEHDRVVRAAVGRRGGHVVKSQGDGFMVVFGSPAAAVAAARTIQRRVSGPGSRRLRRTPIRVRIGIHAGTAVARDGDYFGRNVAKAARVAALAEGGQILVTDEVREALGDTVPLQPCGTQELKGLAGGHALWLVG